MAGRFGRLFGRASWHALPKNNICRSLGTATATRPVALFPFAGATAAFGLGIGVSLWQFHRDQSNESDVALCRSASPEEGKNQVLTRYSFSEAAEQAMPAVVNITAFHGRTAIASGSGFIITEDGTVLTNAHVVEACSSRDAIKITLPDGRYYTGHVESADMVSDIAVIKVTTTDKLPTVKLGKATELRVGEWVCAVGSPGRLQNTLTVGIVSTLERSDIELGLSRRMFYIQTDAAINQGNSGGPLINLDGEVVGIMTFTARGMQGISFAIPIDLAKEVVQQLKTTGKVQRPYLGIKMMTLNKSVLEELQRTESNVPSSVPEGVLVVHVSPESPAAKAGLQAGDVIVSFDGRATKDTKDIHLALGLNVGKTANVSIVRRAKNASSDVRLELKIKTAALTL
mmetsp:Transcript_2795/g.6823  ORF Transcript_2795/g.6823 Transcript_2795/m.6823 type:complete len:400 (+) Transcript_2795:3-1202(+)